MYRQGDSEGIFSVFRVELPCGGIPLSALPKDTIRELAELFSHYPLLNVKQGNYEHRLRKSSGLTRRGTRNQDYRI